MTIEQLTKQIFDECEKDGEPVTLEEAREMAEMELGAKGMNREAKALETKPKTEKKPKVVQVSQEKQDLFALIWEGLSNYYDNCEILTNNKLISVQIGEHKFKIDIVEQRNKKK